MSKDPDVLAAANLGIHVRGTAKAKELSESPQPLLKQPGSSRLTHALFCSSILILNFDTGIVPASLFKITQEIDMTFQQQAAIGSLVFLGICVGSLVVTSVFQQFSAQKILSCVMLLNAISAGVFSVSSNLYILYITRFIMGFTKSFFVIYGPVWVNEFSPPESCTKWLAALQASSTLGIIIGYVMAGVIINILYDYGTWRTAIQIQVVFLIPLLLWLRATYYKNIDIIDTTDFRKTTTLVSPGDRPTGESKFVRMDTVNISHLSSYMQQLKMLFSNSLFIFITLSLCSLCFVVTGIQYWITLYLIQVLNSNPAEVVLLFSIICTTGPMSGVMFGGWLSDHMGGYKGENLITAVELCVIFSLFASVFSISIGFVGTLNYVCPLLWIMMFFGGALFPTATGININSLSREYQSSASSFSQLAFNLGSYFAPVISATVMDYYEDPIEGLRWGFRTVLFASTLGVVFLLVAWIICSARHGRKGEYNDFDEEKDVVGELKNYSNNEYKNEILLRRLHSYSF
ncbi:unnamed protein product [Blepharisma stoltei]|uniref:Major facilitator superfamily (MFS) profile domain-containing protein n=1 Tax=Blepharisma stoltei TaxID=1481888 RepID=A0AAU9ICR2_9CILI|nr:unnamed protein product [Blepharisma stoltei]